MDKTILILILCILLAVGLIIFKDDKSPEYDYERARTDFYWTIEGREVLRITSDAFYVEGRWTANDKEIYQNFKRWLDYTMEIIE